jgi:probable DNA metabolism protein
MNTAYDGSIESLFRILEEVRNGRPLPNLSDENAYSATRVEDGLFADLNVSHETKLLQKAPPLHWHGRLVNVSHETSVREETSLTPAFFDAFDAPFAREFAELSLFAYTSFIYGWLSELPIATELVRFAWKAFSAAKNVSCETKTEEARLAAEKAVSDRGDDAVAAVLAAAFKTKREIHRLAGMLRFTPVGEASQKDDVYIAYCAPDHFVLPPLAQHFFLRFGPSPWAIIDEKRALVLYALNGDVGLKDAQACGLPNVSPETSDSAAPEFWESLWRQYHKDVNNESRQNPGLQRQFMPKRYWKYLPEMKK